MTRYYFYLFLYLFMLTLSGISISHSYSSFFSKGISSKEVSFLIRKRRSDAFEQIYLNENTTTQDGSFDSGEETLISRFRSLLQSSIFNLQSSIVKTLTNLAANCLICNSGPPIYLRIHSLTI